MHPDTGYHSWLLVDNLIFDFTADQFTEFAEPLFGAVQSRFHDYICGEPKIMNYQKTISIGDLTWHLEEFEPVRILLAQRLNASETL